MRRRGERAAAMLRRAPSTSPSAAHECPVRVRVKNAHGTAPHVVEHRAQVEDQSLTDRLRRSSASRSPGQPSATAMSAMRPATAARPCCWESPSTIALTDSAGQHALRTARHADTTSAPRNCTSSCGERRSCRCASCFTMSCVFITRCSEFHAAASTCPRSLPDLASPPSPLSGRTNLGPQPELRSIRRGHSGRGVSGEPDLRHRRCRYALTVVADDLTSLVFPVEPRRTMSSCDRPMKFTHHELLLNGGVVAAGTSSRPRRGRARSRRRTPSASPVDRATARASNGLKCISPRAYRTVRTASGSSPVTRARGARPSRPWPTRCSADPESGRRSKPATPVRRGGLNYTRRAPGRRCHRPRTRSGPPSPEVMRFEPPGLSTTSLPRLCRDGGSRRPAATSGSQTGVRVRQHVHALSACSAPEAIELLKHHGPRQQPRWEACGARPCGAHEPRRVIPVHPVRRSSEVM